SSATARSRRGRRRASGWCGSRRARTQSSSSNGRVLVPRGLLRVSLQRMIESGMRFDDYLRRVNQPAPRAASLEALRRLHLAHRETFLFENLTIQEGGGISLALADLERKSLDEGRGGYCFEHNTLFAAALGDAGFAATTLLGRVRRGPPERWARTHMVLRLEVDGEPWLADVGFGCA